MFYLPQTCLQSGSTLVELIISSHPGVEEAGELTEIFIMHDRIFPNNEPRSYRKKLMEHADAYLAVLINERRCETSC